jgi:hypothetical protein
MMYGMQFDILASSIKMGAEQSYSATTIPIATTKTPTSVHLQLGVATSTTNDDDKQWNEAKAITDDLWNTLPRVSSLSSLPTSSNGWSNDIKDYIFLQRLGKKTNPRKYVKWYGSMAAVYRVRLTDDAVLRCVMNGVPADECNCDFVVKIIYNDTDNATEADLKVNQVTESHRSVKNKRY